MRITSTRHCANEVPVAMIADRKLSAVRRALTQPVYLTTAGVYERAFKGLSKLSLEELDALEVILDARDRATEHRVQDEAPPYIPLQEVC